MRSYKEVLDLDEHRSLKSARPLPGRSRHPTQPFCSRRNWPGKTSRKFSKGPSMHQFQSTEQRVLLGPATVDLGLSSVRGLGEQFGGSVSKLEDLFSASPLRDCQCRKCSRKLASVSSQPLCVFTPPGSSRSKACSSDPQRRFGLESGAVLFSG